MKLPQLLLAGLLVSSVSLSYAEDTVKKPWKNVTELSLVSANGNSKSTTASFKNAYNYDWSKAGIELIGGGLGANSNGRPTAEQYFASEKISYKVSDLNYVFEKSAWDKNRFAGIRNRWDNQAGMGRQLIKTPNDLLIAELGGGYISEERYRQRTNGFASARAYSKYSRVLSLTSNFIQDAEYIANFEDGSDYRVNTETSLIAALVTHLALKVSYKWQHVGNPPPGYGRNDTTTTVSIVATY